MFVCRAVVVLQLFFLVAMEAEPIRQPDALVPSLCSDLKQAICQVCGFSGQEEDRCCWEEDTYRRCIDSLLSQSQPPSVDRSAAEPWAVGPSASQISEKRAKYFLGKRVKYFLGKRGGRGRDAGASIDDDNETPFRLSDEAEKRAKYFLGK